MQIDRHVPHSLDRSDAANVIEMRMGEPDRFQRHAFVADRIDEHLSFITGVNGYDPLTTTNYKTTGEGWRLRALERLMAMNHANLFDNSFEATAKNARMTEGVVADTLA